MAGKLRIISGKFAHRLVSVPAGADKGLVRPTTDKVRGAIFSSLFTKIVDANVLDICAGSGAQGLEAISRGAASVVFVEKDRRTAATVLENIRALDVESACEVYVGDAERFVKDFGQKYFDVVFVDPPYGFQFSKEFWELLRRFLNEESIVVYRCPKGQGFSAKEYGYEVLKQKVYGSMEVWFIKSAGALILQLA